MELGPTLCFLFFGSECYWLHLVKLAGTSDNHQVIDENEVVDTALPQKKKLMGISSCRGTLLQNPYSSVKEILLRRIVV